MKKLQPTEYMYASARIRSLENYIVGRERMELLIEARTSEEVMERLAEYGLKLPETPDGTPPQGEAISAAREAMLLTVLQRAFEEVEGAVPDPSLFRYLRYPYDCNNLKAAVKCGIRGVSAEDMLFDFGTVPADQVEALVREGSYQAFPPAMATAISQARDAYDRTGDPRRIDTVLDNACYADMLAAALQTGDETLISWMRAKLDLTNILTTLRILRMRMGGAGEAFLREALLEGGTLKEGFFAEAYEAGEEGLFAALSPTVYCHLADVEGDPRPLSVVEKACDDLYMELVKKGARVPFGAPVVGGYLLGCEVSVKNIRIVLAAKDAELDTAVIRERIRVSYV